MLPQYWRDAWSRSSTLTPKMKYSWSTFHLGHPVQLTRAWLKNSAKMVPKALYQRGRVQTSPVLLPRCLPLVPKRCSRRERRSFSLCFLVSCLTTLHTPPRPSFTLPQTVGNLHRTIFFEFKCAELLQAVIVSEDMAFKEVIAREMGSCRRLHETPPALLQRFFRGKSNKVAPASDVETCVSHSEVIHLKNESIRQNKQKRPAIIRIFSAVARTLTKPFTSS
ncbi:hypothetical protein ABVT39_019125 [Epinephelus coioides]